MTGLREAGGKGRRHGTPSPEGSTTGARASGAEPCGARDPPGPEVELSMGGKASGAGTKVEVGRHWGLADG